jgi:hypothetical protein
VAPAPLVIRSLADVQALSAAPKALKRLPPNGLVIDIPGLDEQASDTFREQTRRYARACGCAAGGATFLLGSAGCVAYAVHLALVHAWTGCARTLAASAILVPGLTAAAKCLALWLARQRFRRNCVHLIRSLSGHPTGLDNRRTPHVL